MPKNGAAKCFYPSTVMAGLVPAIHVFRASSKQGVDARDNPRMTN
jgi:hypothetical protein